MAPAGPDGVVRSGTGASGGSCPDSIAVYRAKLAEVDASLARLQAIRAELEGQLEQARCQFTGGET